MGLNVRRALREIVFPRTCNGCGYHLADGERSLCFGCRDQLERVEESRIGWVYDIIPDRVLFRVALWRFSPNGSLRDLLHKVKYGRRRDLGIDLGVELGGLMKRVSARLGFESRFEPVFVPVPLHRARIRKRGYNQSRLIALGASEVTGWSVLPEGRLIRVRNTRSQTGLNLSERESNVQGAFDCRGLEFLPQELPVLIDDVYTTGATLAELSGVMLQAGADRVGIATLARA